MSLNRTSVGLKRLRPMTRAIILAQTPQSNQRGIETFSPSHRALYQSKPQSNQRGIETLHHARVSTAGG